MFQYARKTGAQSGLFATIRENMNIAYQKIRLEMEHVEKRLKDLEEIRAEVKALEKLKIVVERRQTQFKQRYETVKIENEN